MPKELEQQKLEQKKVIEKAFGERGFSISEVNAIIQAKENGENFPLSDDKWYELPILYRGYYWDYVAWVKSGKKDIAPEVPKMLEKELNQSSVPSLSSPEESFIKDPELLEFEQLEAACNQASEKVETKKDDNMKKPRPISVVAPLPQFSKIPKLGRSNSTFSTDSNVSLESNSSRCSRSSKINAHSLVDCTSGPTKSKASDYYPKANKREFLQTEPDKKQTARIDTKPSTPRPKKKEINFIERNKQNISALFKESKARKDGPTTSTPSFTNMKQ